LTNDILNPARIGTQPCIHIGQWWSSARCTDTDEPVDALGDGIEQWSTVRIDARSRPLVGTANGFIGLKINRFKGVVTHGAIGDLNGSLVE
jgi:hypothetical protein